MSIAELDVISRFLPCPTPKAWLDAASENLEILLVDHAHCEKKAASSALSMLYRYPQHLALLKHLSSLAREELLHFEKVLEILKQRNIHYRHLAPSDYAASLHRTIRREEPHRLIDQLIIAAIIEARSCERFAALTPLLDEKLAGFYRSLLRSEARHFEDYLGFARELSDENIDARIGELLRLEGAYINTPDPLFRFHSGVPSANRPAHRPE